MLVRAIVGDGIVERADVFPRSGGPLAPHVGKLVFLLQLVFKQKREKLIALSF